MKHFLFPTLAVLLAGAVCPAHAQAPPPQLEGYQPGPYERTADSKPQPGVPKGEVLHFTFENSKIFPGTFRDYWVYVPAQYKPDKPACVYVNQDGVQWNAPQVFDNLIAKGEMPVTIGVFIMHGRVRAKDEKAALDRFNRSLEYDGLGDRYARFVLEELLPDVETKKASDGRAIVLSKSGNDRAIGGSSSGAVCAFTAAWERPDAFTRVFSTIGTYVGLRGANNYPTLIRKYEPKPLRVFLQDGVNDLNIYGGDWWIANQAMERSLTFAGYDVRHAWGELGHDGRQGDVLFPDVMRYLWGGWPKPVETVRRSNNGMLNDVVQAGETWQVVGDVAPLSSLSVNEGGDVLVNTGVSMFRVGADNKLVPVPPPRPQAGANRATYRFDAGRGEITVYDNKGKSKAATRGVNESNIVAANNGALFLAQPARNGSLYGNVTRYASDGKAVVVDTNGVSNPGGVTLSPDQTLLYLSDRASHWVYSYQVQPDGALTAKQQYYWLHSPDDRDDSGANAMVTDRAGRLYVATALGIQVADQAGRVNVVLPVPGADKAYQAVTSLAFGDKDLNTLYAVAGSKLYRRKMQAVGVLPMLPPLRPNPPGL